MTFRVPFLPALWVPTFLRNLLVWSQARRDGKFKWYACWDVILRWLGKRVAWDPEAHPTHRRIREALALPAAFPGWLREREATEKELAKRPSFWVLVTFFLLLMGGEFFGDLQLLKNLGLEAGMRRVLMAFALGAVLFALPVIAVKFATTTKGRRSPWFWVAMALIAVIVVVIGTIQVGETSATPGETSAQDVAAGLLLSFAVVGPALLAKFVLAALFPVWQLRKERARLHRQITRAKREQQTAQTYIDRCMLYLQWYDGQAAQIASVYRRAFARIFLKLHNDVDGLRRLMANDTPGEREGALGSPLEITRGFIEPATPRLTAVNTDVVNPYDRDRA